MYIALITVMYYKIYVYAWTFFQQFLNGLIFPLDEAVFALDSLSVRGPKEQRES